MPASSLETVDYELVGHVATITLDRPDALNAFNPAMYADFNAAMAEFRDDDDAWAAVVTGRGLRSFSAGVDVKALDREVESSDNPGGSEVAARFGIEFSGEYFTDKPVLAAIEGYCYGEGLSMALACDLRVCGSSASFCLPESKIGVPTVVASIRGTQLLGLSRYLELVLTAQPRDSGWAEQAGLVNRVVADGDALTTALAWAADITALSPLANRATKNVAAHSHVRSFEESRAYGLRKRAEAIASHDFAEGRRAFIEKRAPKFEGR